MSHDHTEPLSVPFIAGQSARDIIELMLSKTGNAVLQNDFEAMSACFSVPFVHETPDTKIVVRTKEEHGIFFDKLIEGYRRKNVTEIIRICEDAQFVSPTMIRSLHVSHLMSGDQRLENPMPTLATTELFETTWRITAAQYIASRQNPVGYAMDYTVRSLDPKQ